MSNSRLSLELLPKQSFRPGDTVRVSLTLAVPEQDFTDISLELRCTTSVRIQQAKDSEGNLRGRQKYQLSSTTGIQASETYRDKYVVFSTPLLFLAPHKPKREVSEKKRNNEDKSPLAGVYEVVIPPFEEDTLLPSFPKSINEPAARAEVSYRIVVVEHRYGLFKLNDTLHLPISVNFPSTTPPPIDESEWPSATASDALLLDGAPTLNAVLVARPSTSPLTPITFQLSLSSTASLSFADVLASSYLSYEIESTPTQGVDRETSHHSAAIKVALGNLTEMGDAGNLEWVGEILPEKRERTIIASWIKVQYILTCSIHSPLLETPLFVNLPVFLPSETAGGERTIDEAAQGAVAGELPPTYSRRASREWVTPVASSSS